MEKNLQKILQRLSFLLGGGQVETKATKAAEALLKRDFYPIFDLKSQVNFSSKSYFASVPSSFLSKSPKVLDTTEISTFIETSDHILKLEIKK